MKMYIYIYAYIYIYDSRRISEIGPRTQAGSMPFASASVGPALLAGSDWSLGVFWNGLGKFCSELERGHLKW